MKKSYVITAIACFASVSTFAQLGPINVISSTSGTTYVASDSSLLTSGLLRFGLFDEAAYDLLAPEDQIDFSAVSPLFSELGSVASSGGNFNLNSFVIPAQTITDTGVAVGDKIYTWVTNTADPSLATQWGLFSSSNPFWDVKASPAPSLVNAALVDNFVVGASSGDGPQLAPIPESSTFALIAGVFGLGFVMYRRRK